MKQVKIFLALPLMIGIPNVIISVALGGIHTPWLAVSSYISAFIGTALIFGMDGFRSRPTNIGNVDGNKTIPRINQNWIVFFISLIINLTMANLCGGTGEVY